MPLGRVMTDQPRIVCWFSRGAASAVATKLTISQRINREVIPVLCETGSEHADNARFGAECERWFGIPVTVLKSSEYADTWDVWKRRKYIAGIDGAPCTMALKIEPRFAFQRADDVHVFGYTADANDIKRAAKLREHFFEMTIETPLIDRGLTKAACLDMVTRAGIQPPITYAMGLPNANCIPCPKATSPAYWALIRQKFPAEFARMVALSRELDVRLTRRGEERIFIDEIAADHPVTGAITPSCDFLCAIAEQDL